jgi:hypothetical protein
MKRMMMVMESTPLLIADQLAAPVFHVHFVARRNWCRRSRIWLRGQLSGPICDAVDVAPRLKVMVLSR